MQSNNDLSSEIYEQLQERYQRAFKMENESNNYSPKDTGRVFINTTVYPNWIAGSECFWYKREIETGHEFRLVDAISGSNQCAFDHAGLAEKLSKACKQTVSPDQLSIENLTFLLESGTLQFSAFDQHWSYHIEQNQLTEAKVFPESWRVSPDGSQAAFVRDNNLWVRDLANDKERALTEDGDHFYVYAATASVYGREEFSTVEAIWSSDSQRLFTLVRDTRDVAIGPPLVQHVPEDGGRPKILHPDRRVGLAGDEHIEVYRLLAIEVDSGRVQMANYGGCPVYMLPYKGLFSGKQGWWSKDNRHAYFVELERGGLAARLVEFDTNNGQTRVVIEDTDTARITLMPQSHVCVLIEPLRDTNEVIWYSERSGWAHLYLYDLSTGTLKNAITQGEWVVRTVLHYDATKREVWIQTGGRTAGRNPYYCDICRVNIDSGELTPVISTDHEYLVCDQRSRATGFHHPGKGVSPGANYVVCTRSRVDQLPVSVLLDCNGNEVMELETGEVPGLPAHWRWPEPIMLKGADGETDIYAVVFRPSDFSPDKRYPILDCSFGDFIPVGSFTNNMGFASFSMSAMAYAELGFIAVMVLSRGTCMRSRAFYKDKDSSLFFACHVDDHVAVIEQLAERYDYMDIDRVGISTHTSTALPIQALLKYPDFFKVGVMQNAFSDMTITAEFFGEYCSAGLSPDLDDRQEIYSMVDRLKGKLLIIHGMLDDCTPVATAFRLVESLQKANKDFDMLFLPNLGHFRTGYVMRRRWDYLIRHLQNFEPPKEIEI